MKKQMHINSLISYAELAPTLSEKQKPVFAFLIKNEGRAYTDREIKTALGADDMNSVRPRITELCADNVLEEVDQVNCTKTGRLVRRVKIKEMV